MTIWPIGHTYDGREISDLPSDYMQWALEQPWFEDRFPDLHEEVTNVMTERTRQDTHWDRWEEDMDMSDVLYGERG